VTGYVPQDDILYAALSVEENFIFAARFRLPAGTSEAQRRVHVDNTLISLGLENVRRDIVGGEVQRGLSGGQRKRVSIGVELVAAPRLLLLDEPTSGLDAAGARSLVSTLLTLVARDKVTVAAVVHQPRHEAFLLFNDVLLLARGGRAAYYGPVSQVEEYFLSLGNRFPSKTNPADALLDILAVQPDALCDAWAMHRFEEQQRQQREEGDIGGGDLFRLPEAELSPALSLSSGNSINSVVVLGNLHEETSASLFMRAKETTILAATFFIKLIISIQDCLPSFRQLLFWKDRNHFEHRAGYSSLSSSPSSPAPLAAPAKFPPSPGFNQQFIWCLSRAAILRSREPVQTFIDIAIIAATGTTIGLLSDRGRATIMSYASEVTFSCVALGLMATVGSIPTFTENEAAFRREAASGFNRGAYFAALSFFDFTGSCIRAAAYLATWASFANPKTVLWQYYVVSLGLFWFCSGIGYVLALGLGSGAAQLAAAVITLIATLVARQPEARGLLSIIQQFSFARWALEGFVIAESNRLSGVWLLARCADLLALGYDVRRFTSCLVALTALGVAARGLALGMLLLMKT
jgi:ABC-type multidrug transport system ATPase subunit